MDTTRRDVLSGLFAGGVAVFSGCSTSQQSNDGSDSQQTTNEVEQPVSNTQVANPTTTNLQPTTRSASAETMASEDSSLMEGTRVGQGTSGSGVGTESEVWVGEGQNWSEKDSPQKTVTVGDPSKIDQYDKPHSILIWNDDAGPRTIHVSLVPVANQKQNGFQRRFQLKPDSYAVVKMARYRSYTLKAGVSGSPLKKVTQLRKNLVDCNDSSTHVAVRGDGSVDSTTFSTEMACNLSTTLATTDND